MSISLERALRHMAWANQRVYEALETLPEDSFKSFVVNEEWTAYEISFHIRFIAPIPLKETDSWLKCRSFSARISPINYPGCNLS